MDEDFLWHFFNYRFLPQILWHFFHLDFLPQILWQTDHFTILPQNSIRKSNDNWLNQQSALIRTSKP